MLGYSCIVILFLSCQVIFGIPMQTCSLVLKLLFDCDHDHLIEISDVIVLRPNVSICSISFPSFYLRHCSIASVSSYDFLWLSHIYWAFVTLLSIVCSFFTDFVLYRFYFTTLQFVGWFTHPFVLACISFCVIFFIYVSLLHLTCHFVILWYIILFVLSYLFLKYHKSKGR